MVFLVSYLLFLSAGVAFLESKFNLDLQHAMLLVPAFYCLSGIAFYGAEAVIKQEQQTALQAK